LFVEDHVSVEFWPAVIEAGDADIVTTGTAGGGVVPPPEVPAAFKTIESM
jgi:hypothetical protein